MTRKLILIGIVLAGFILTPGSNVWAGHGKHVKRHHYDKGCQQCPKARHGHHYGWAKWKRHPKRCYRRHKPYRHRDYNRPVIKEIGGLRFAFSVADEEGRVSVEVSEAY